MIGPHCHFGAMGLDQWGVDTAYFMKLMYRGLSMEPYNRSPSQSFCNYMFKFQEVDIFQSPRGLLRTLSGKFLPGENGIQIESFEVAKGSSRGECDSPDLLGRNKGILECLEALEAFIRTFINIELPSVFAPVQETLSSSEFLHRTSSKIILKYLNEGYSVVFNGLCTHTKIKTMAHPEPISIKGIAQFGRVLLEISQAIVIVDEKHYGRPMALFRPRLPEYIVESDSSV